MSQVVRKRYLMLAYAGKGDKKKALEFGKALLEKERKYMGEDHPETIKLIRDLEKLERE